jgi:hypothetical protein
MGFNNIEEARNYIMNAYHESLAKAPDSETNPPRLICHSDTDMESVEFPTGTYLFDRRAKTWCDEWEIKKGEIFVAIGFNQNMKAPPGPHLPGVIPDWLPGHLHWFFFTDHHDGKSHWDFGMYSQEYDHQFDGSQYPSLPVGGFLNWGSMMINKGMTTKSEYGWIVTGLISVLVFFVLGFGLCLYQAVRALAIARKKA